MPTRDHCCLHVLAVVVLEGSLQPSDTRTSTCTTCTGLTQSLIHPPRGRSLSNMMSSSATAVGSLLVAMLTGSFVPTSTEAWTTAQPHLMRATSAASSPRASPLTGVPSLSTRAVTRWDEHLNLARREHHRKNWGQVRQVCAGVISIADDWTAQEQAHLRLALAEQKAQRVDAARRAFQVRVGRLLCSLAVVVQ